MLSRDARTLALSDAVLVLSTGICVPFAKAVSRGWIKYYWTGVIFQHLLQASILFAAIKWTFNRLVFSPFSAVTDNLTNMGSQWPWVQSGFLTLHTLVRGLTYLTHMQSAEIRSFDPDDAHENAFLYGNQWLLAIRVPTIWGDTGTAS